MTTLVDWMHLLGEATIHTFWTPLLAWTVAALVAMGFLPQCRSAHTLVQYAARTALLLALPLGLLLAAVTDISILALFPRSVAETPVESLFALPLSDVDSALNAAKTFVWTPYHFLGLLTLLGGLLAAGRLAYLVRHALALTHFRKRLPLDTAAPTQQAVDRQAAALGLRRRVRVVVTTQDVVPMTLGWLRPVIVMPETLTNDAERLHMTLLHELIHIRRQDVLLQGLEHVIGALFLINPMVWILRRSIGQYREMACDAEVVTQPRVSSKRYAALLYSFASPPAYRRRFALSMSGSDKELKKRILAMKSLARSPHRRFSPKGISLGLAAVLLTSATVFVACSDLGGPVQAMDEAAPDAASKAEVFVIVDEMPELVGGLNAIQEQLNYPAIAKEAGIEGRVIVQFVVNEEGRAVDPKVVKGLGGGLDEEALRVVKLATFKPGKQAGKIVPVKLSLPFTFRLSEDPLPPSTEAIVQPSAPEMVADGVHVVVEQMPELIGGLEALQVQLKYPTIAKRAGIEGRVILQFVVDEQGQVVDPKVLKGIGGGCDEEAVRALRQARFEPGRQDGQPVNVMMSIPVTFKLDDEDPAH